MGRKRHACCLERYLCLPSAQLTLRTPGPAVPCVRTSEWRSWPCDFGVRSHAGCGRFQAAGLAGDVAGSDGGQHRFGLTGGEVAFGLPRQEFREEGLKPVDGLDPSAGECFTTVGEHPQRLSPPSTCNTRRVLVRTATIAIECGVVIGLAVVSGVEEPHPAASFAGTSRTCSPQSNSR